MAPLTPLLKASSGPSDPDEPSEPPEKDLPALATAGFTGLRQLSGDVVEEFHRDLRDLKQRVRIFKEMRDNDALIGAWVFLTESLVRQVDWFGKPSDEDLPAAQHEATFLDENLTDMDQPFECFVSEALSMNVFGFAPFEMIFKLRRGPEQESDKLRSRFSDGRIGTQALEIRSQDSVEEWTFDDRDRWSGFWQQIDTRGGRWFIPRSKCLLFRPRSHKDNPEGRSLLRNAYRPWFFKKRLEEMEGIYVERLGGFPDMQVPPEILRANADADEVATRRAWEDSIQKIRLDVLQGMLRPAETDREGQPTGYKFSMIFPSGPNADIDKIVRRYARDVLISLLAEFLLLGSDEVGSFALSSDKTDMFVLALGSILKVIKEELNRVWVPMLMRLNGVPEELWPTIEHGDIEKAEVAAWASSVVSLIGAGVLPPEAAEEKAREMTELKPKEAEEEALQVQRVADDIQRPRIEPTPVSREPEGEAVTP